METKKLRLLRLADVLDAVPYSSSHIWRLERAGEFPKRVRVGRGRVGWVADEVQEWIASRIKERDNAYEN